MKKLRAYIDERGATFAHKPLFAYLRDGNVDPRQRLSFMPFLNHFVMTFADLYNFVLPEEPPRDRYQELINIHVSEDATHWKWFLADLTNAGFDPPLHFSDAIRFIWSKSTVNTRKLSYEICKLTGRADSLEKLAMVMCIEVAGGVALEAAAVAGCALEKQMCRKLVYFGNHHVDTESEHTLEAPTVRGSLDEIVLTEASRASSRTIVQEAFDAFERFIDEIFQLTQKGAGFAEGIGRAFDG